MTWFKYIHFTLLQLLYSEFLRIGFCPLITIDFNTALKFPNAVILTEVISLIWNL